MTTHRNKQNSRWIADRLRQNRDALAALRAHVEQCGGNPFSLPPYVSRRNGRATGAWSGRSPEDASPAVQADRGEHEVVVALGSNSGKAWGVFLRLERTDLPIERLIEGSLAGRLPVLSECEEGNRSTRTATRTDNE